MDMGYLIAFVFLAVICFFLIIYLRNKQHGLKKLRAESQVVLAPQHDSELMVNSVLDLAIFDENGLKVLESMEISEIPVRAHFLDSSGSAINSVKHIASDLFKGAVSVPNKTVEVIFKPEIHKGLADGTYTLMKTKSGEVLADAVDASKKIVGKGRVIQGGKARQLAGGAFQLVSIAVAQSHLADIERSLNAIKVSISEILERQENEDKARITGAFDYLREISIHMKELRCPNELPQQKRNAIEGIVKEFYSWRNKLEEDMASLVSQISMLSDADIFGTGNTFERMEVQIERIGPLLQRRELLLNLASAINFVTAYLDPAQREYSKISINEAFWSELIDRFKNAVLERESVLMGEAFWNFSETLKLRRYKLRALSSDYHRIGHDQQNKYLELRNSLYASMSRFIDPTGSVRVAIAFDGHGNVDKAAIV